MSIVEPRDLSEFANTLKKRNLFDRGASVTIARAPGRLDVMGGIADYSGSLVLQRPIAEATMAACQLTDQPIIEIVSLGRKPVSIHLESLTPAGMPLNYLDAL